VSTYLHFFAKAFKRNLAYRAQVWLTILVNLLAIVIQVSIWRALLSNRSAAGIDLRDMITYVILNSAIYVVMMYEMFHDVDDRLRTGDIAIDLVKPMRYPLYLWADQLGNTAYRLLFTVVPTVLVATVLFGFTGPGSFVHAVGFVIAMAIATTLSFAFAYLIALLAFHFLTTLHFEWTFLGLATMFSGRLLPLWFFPQGWADVARALPFQFLGFVPAAIYMGKMPEREMWLTLIIGLVWVVVLLAAAALMWTVSLRRLVVQGG
jgi:ABC-2 type transport system permease protein